MVTPSQVTPTVFVVDDDDAVRSSLKLLLKSVGHSVVDYPSATAFLAAYKFDKPGTYHYTCSIHPRMVGTIIVE